MVMGSKGLSCHALALMQHLAGVASACHPECGSTGRASAAVLPMAASNFLDYNLIC